MTWVKQNRVLSFAILVGLGFLAYYLVQAVNWIPCPYSTDYGEGFVMNYARLWANGEWKWNINDPPYFTMVYGVGFPMLAYPFVKLFGAELWVGRLMSLSAALVTCLLTYLIAKHIIKSKGVALMAALLPFTQPIFRDWSMMARVDIIAVMFDVLGVYLVLKWKDSDKLYLAAIPFVCAVMVKLSAIAGLLACLIYVYKANRYRIISFAGVFILTLEGVILPLEIMSGFTYWKHVTLYNNTIQNVHWPTFVFLLDKFAYAFMPVGILGAAYVRKCVNDKVLSVCALFAIFAVVIGMITTVKPGAAGLYYLEAIVAASIVASLGLSAWVKAKFANPIMIALMGILAVVYFPRHDVIFPTEQYTKDVQTVQSVVSGKVLSENTALSTPYIEFFVFTNLARLGQWDETPYLQKYESGYFDYVVLKMPVEKRLELSSDGMPDEDFTDNALRDIQSNYSLVWETENKEWPFGMFIYEANNRLKARASNEKAS